MWSISNTSGFPASGSWVQDKDANKIWLVCVKATFDIKPDGKSSISDTQTAPLIQATPRDGDFEKGLVYESDFSGFKPATDVLVNGHAWAPREKPATSVDVGFRVGSVNKRLRVFGDREWRVSFFGRDQISEPKHFLRMPLFYENAFGGWDKTAKDPSEHRVDLRNPLGQGLITNIRAAEGRCLPNIEDPNNLINACSDRPAPAGFGPVSCSWSPRRELAGTYDDAWLMSRFPLWAPDFDTHYYCCAPRDQQIDGYLRGDELVQLVNLSPYGSLRFKLPRLAFGFSTRFRREIVHHRGVLATVILEPNFPRVIMVWQSALVCNKKQDDLDETTVRLKKLIKAA